MFDKTSCKKNKKNPLILLLRWNVLFLPLISVETLLRYGTSWKYNKTLAKNNWDERSYTSIFKVVWRHAALESLRTSGIIHTTKSQRHLYNGQEAVLAGALRNGLDKDRMITAYRNHVQPIGMGVDQNSNGWTFRKSYRDF
jgi:TPP-dependent pyruvate/acetoin dehydrogenase alpha subunit